jgi:hypothetical protein
MKFIQVVALCSDSSCSDTYIWVVYGKACGQEQIL